MSQFGSSFFMFCHRLGKHGETKAAAAKTMNMAIAFMYQGGFWIKSIHAKKLSYLIYFFLAKYAVCASLTLRQKLRRFSIQPKCHMICHEAYRLLVDAGKAQWVVNPIVHSNQLQEDFIGRPARLSRRVNIKNVHWNVMRRCLIVYQHELGKSDQDVRGLDAYGLWQEIQKRLSQECFHIRNKTYCCAFGFLLAACIERCNRRDSWKEKKGKKGTDTGRKQ